ncbi:hypothetical protein HWB57_gp035 [Erwinia phage vB_EamM-Bue1]|uniref:Uncharacterized protein n=1 Tax=Erwinia phage vB_EamM-Bue1 TaxID=2099338 RepID=A0A2U9PDW2_9CAUD|nr:hypothetical protein HWB57_gp035 [Erwinia phage vB_EamM-Bue1]AWT50342.1 hypothetical protein [Erwinia phage vB_EamM-Bue1]
MSEALVNLGIMITVAVTIAWFVGSDAASKLDDMVHEFLYKRSKKGRAQAQHSQRLRIQKIVEQARKEQKDAM